MNKTELITHLMDEYKAALLQKEILEVERG